MNDYELSPDDPRLTAYALGELEGDQRASVEAALRANPELRGQVEEIRAMAAQLEAALAAEAAEPIEAVFGEKARAHRVNGHAAPAMDDGREPVVGTARVGRRRGGKLIRFPQFYYVVGGLAAACFALVVGLNRADVLEQQRVRDEQQRVAWEKRAAEARAATNAAATVGQVAVSLTETTAPAATGPAVEAVAGTGGVGERAEPAAVPDVAVTVPETTRARVAFAPIDLRLLRQVEDDATAGPLAFGAMMPLMLEETVSLPARAVAEMAPLQLALTYTPGAAGDEAQASGLAAGDLAPVASRVFVAPATVATSGAYSRTPAAGSEIVMLSAVSVTADRLNAFGAISASARRWAVYDPDAVERDFRPRPPTGARFARNPRGEVRDNEFLRAAFHPLSTFSAEVDSGSFGTVRRMLTRGELPPREAVRIEEMLNYFPYRYATPPERRLSFFEKLGGEDPKPPFAASLEVAAAPWAPQHRLVRIGLKGREAPVAERPQANLVFLVDVSSSMNDPTKLPLVKDSLRLLVGKLRPDDKVAIVTYGGNAGVALGSTPVERQREIMAAIDGLAPSGIADGETGIRHAYEIAQANYAEDGINRVILCTDGDFALGPTTDSELLRLVEARAGTGVYLSVLGFGMRDYRDATLEQLADRGNGSYGYIDSRREAQKMLVDQISSTLVTIAKDMKIQVEFNPAKVASYRLIGYENRLLRKEDFNLDDVDAGEIGAGHAVTALYEIVPVGATSPVLASAASGTTDTWKQVNQASDDVFGFRLGMSLRQGGEDLLKVKVRYTKPGVRFAFPRTSEFPLKDGGATFAEASADFRFAAAVAQLGMILRQSPYRGAASIGDVIAWAGSAAVNPADDPGGYRGEFIELARRARELLKME